MTTSYIIIDGNSLAYASQAIVERDPKKRLIHPNGSEVTAIFGVIRAIKASISMLCTHRTPERIIVTWDSRAQWRRDIYPAYKGNRDSEERNETVEALKAQRSDIETILTPLGIDQLRIHGSEADDIAAMLTDLALRKGHDVVLVSNDKDWAQLVGEHVNFHSPLRSLKGRDEYTLDSFHELTGFNISPTQFVDFKALTGDSSDNIPGVGGIGEKGAASLLEKWGSVENFFSDVRTSTLPKPLACLYDNTVATQTAKRGESIGSRDIYHRNLKLVDLQFGKRNVDRSKAELIKGKYDLDKFDSLCRMHNFTSVVAMIGEWRNIFYRG